MNKAAPELSAPSIGSMRSLWLPTDWAAMWRSPWPPGDTDDLGGRYEVVPLMEAEGGDAALLAALQRALTLHKSATVLVSLMAQKAEVYFDPAYIMPSQIASKVSELGYSATVNEAANTGDGILDLNVSQQVHFTFMDVVWCLILIKLITS